MKDILIKMGRVAEELERHGGALANLVTALAELVLLVRQAVGLVKEKAEAQKGGD